MKKTGQAAVLLTVIFLLAAAFSAAACADVIISEVMASNGFYENGEGKRCGHNLGGGAVRA